ncbi:cytochrome c oxidase subunit 7A2b isoform X1 [Astatotilapia calliptera]|uniref:cytochrome c oxidase subunit 7A2b isoform X1 n=1 Tax=Maylandia zebra TaxID=106582 RepID=UPI00032A2E1D|nr:cytochrome c oxidase subunit 7A2, mitochondrial isoform X1 [Maylandia zebra]XP_025998995.1 cytochrome c oxidase subunit 7A2, mitochondrial isoform X1 [Astatotilapia calliptera]
MRFSRWRGGASPAPSGGRLRTKSPRNRRCSSSGSSNEDTSVSLAPQEDNGMPVHLKGGSADALLYRTTMALTVLGVGYVLFELVKAAFPQKK